MGNDTKSVADVTDVPKGLDVVPTVPGTFVGGHDVQGADGKERTDRPGEILGTPAGKSTKHDKTARETELEKTDFVTAEVDRTNREVLPLLGGPNDETRWEAEKGGVPEFIANARTITPKGDKGVTTAKLAGTRSFTGETVPPVTQAPSPGLKK